MDLGFLSNVKLEPVKKTASVKKQPVVSLPETADLRVYPNGKVYPSKAFAEKFALEFVPKVNVASEGENPILEVQGNGLDIFSTLSWGMMTAARQSGALEKEFLCIVVVPKTQAKVDMWASTKYEENEPKASVFTQGASTFAKKQLLALIETTYEVNWAEVDYVDLMAVQDTPIVSESGIYHIPKIVSTGAKKGEPTYIRRENITVNPLVIAEVKSSEPKEEAKEDVIAEKTPNAPVDEVAGDAVESTDATADPGEDWAQKLGAKEPAGEA